LRMIFSENRFPPRIKSGAGFFGITRYGWMMSTIVRSAGLTINTRLPSVAYA